MSDAAEVLMFESGWFGNRLIGPFPWWRATPSCGPQSESQAAVAVTGLEVEREAFGRPAAETRDAVNVGEKMHRRAGVKMHQGGTPESPAGPSGVPVGWRHLRQLVVPYWCDVWRRWDREGSIPAKSLLALLEPVAVPVHFKDVNVVGQPVEQRSGEPLGREHAGPLVERICSTRVGSGLPG